MTQSSYLAVIATSPLIALASSVLVTTPGKATGLVSVACQQQTSVPTVTVTLSHQNVSRVTSILSFLPQYFEAIEGLNLCQSTAEKLNAFYNGYSKINYLASDTLEGRAVVCAVERRGVGCDSYNSQVLFSVNQAISPTELLYNMLGKDFKGSRIPSSRTISRIYTDIRPMWWPF